MLRSSRRSRSTVRRCESVSAELAFVTSLRYSPATASIARCRSALSCAFELVARHVHASPPASRTSSASHSNASTVRGSAGSATRPSTTWTAPKRRSLRHSLATDAAWYLIATTANVIAAFVFLPELSRLSIPGLAEAIHSLPWSARLGIAIVLYDFVAFAVHVWLHRFEVLWSVHKVHHSSLQLDWLTTTRAHMFENLVRQVAAQAPLFALGMPASTVALTLV